MWADVTLEEEREALDSCAEELLWECGITEPAIDAMLMAMRLGLRVAHDDCLPARAALVRVRQDREEGATAVVILGEEERYERQQFSLAHEVAEFAAPRVAERLGLSPYDMPVGTREQLANRLAGRLLVPTTWLRRVAAECDWDLAALKERFSTASHELIARRMLDMSPPVVMTVFDHGEVTWRKANRRLTANKLLAAERQVWHNCHELGVANEEAQVETEGGPVRVQCWPVHEPGWKREIMRTEVLAWD